MNLQGGKKNEEKRKKLEKDVIIRGMCG